MKRWFRRGRGRTFDECVRADEFRKTLRRAKNGDGAAITTLYRLLQPRLVRYLGVVIPAHADRLAAETWLEVIGVLARFDGDEHALYALAFAAARRRADGAGGARRDTPRSLDREPVVDHPVDTRVDDDGMAGLGLRSALGAIAHLPRDQAEVVLLRVLGELSVDEVADLLDRPPEAIGTLQARALRTLHWLPSAAGAAT